MNAIEAKEKSQKAIHKNDVKPILEVLYADIKKAAKNGDREIKKEIVPHPRVGVMGVVRAVLEDKGYVTTSVTNSDRVMYQISW